MYKFYCRTHGDDSQATLRSDRKYIAGMADLRLASYLRNQKLTNNDLVYNNDCIFCFVLISLFEHIHVGQPYDIFIYDHTVCGKGKTTLDCII